MLFAWGNNLDKVTFHKDAQGVENRGTNLPDWPLKVFQDQGQVHGNAPFQAGTTVFLPTREPRQVHTWTVLTTGEIAQTYPESWKW